MKTTVFQPDLKAAAIAALDADRFDDAESAASAILAARPTDAEALHLMGRVALGRRQLKAAVAWLTRSVFAQPRDGAARVSLGQALLAGGQPADAVEALTEAVRFHPRNAEAHFLLGTTLGQLDQLERSLTALRRAAELAPGKPAIWRNLGVCLSRLQRYAEAEDCLTRSLALDPENAGRQYDLAVLHLKRRNTAQACDLLEMVVQRAPDHLDAHAALGRLRLGQGQFAAALPHLEHAARREPVDPAFLLDIARARRETGHLAEAAAAYERVLAHTPNSSRARIGLAVVRTGQGRVDEAVALYDDVLWTDPENPAALGNLARLHRFFPGDPLIARMSSVARRGDLTPGDKVQLEFALGKALDDVGDYEAAIVHFAHANRLTGRAGSFDPGAHRAFVDGIIEIFDATYFAARRDCGAASDRPVFVVGMGRSGTSLAEQILASHPDVFGAGELPDIERLATRAQEHAGTETPGRTTDSFPEIVTRLPLQHTAELGQAYLERLHRMTPDATRIVDKMPLNFLYLGFIATILPGARIIHCRRDPLDTCLSLYFQHFADQQSYAYDLAHLGFYYQQYERLMTHWRRVLPLAIFELQYETLVEHQEWESQRMIAFCGLPWDARCLDFHRTERAAATASVWQVRQPIYRRSVGRWRNYAAHLGPLKDALQGHRSIGAE